MSYRDETMAPEVINFPTDRELPDYVCMDIVYNQAVINAGVKTSYNSFYSQPINIVLADPSHDIDLVESKILFDLYCTNQNTGATIDYSQYGLIPYPGIEQCFDISWFRMGNANIVPTTQFYPGFSVLFNQITKDGPYLTRQQWNDGSTYQNSRTNYAISPTQTVCVIDNTDNKSYFKFYQQDVVQKMMRVYQASTTSSATTGCTAPTLNVPTAFGGLSVTEQAYPLAQRFLYSTANTGNFALSIPNQGVSNTASITSAFNSTDQIYGRFSISLVNIVPQLATLPVSLLRHFPLSMMNQLNMRFTLVPAYLCCVLGAIDGNNNTSTAVKQIDNQNFNYTLTDLTWKQVGFQRTPQSLINLESRMSRIMLYPFADIVYQGFPITTANGLQQYQIQASMEDLRGIIIGINCNGQALSNFKTAGQSGVSSTIVYPNAGYNLFDTSANFPWTTQHRFFPFNASQIYFQIGSSGARYPTTDPNLLSGAYWTPEFIQNGLRQIFGDGLCMNNQLEKTLLQSNLIPLPFQRDISGGSPIQLQNQANQLVLSINWQTMNTQIDPFLNVQNCYLNIWRISNRFLKLGNAIQSVI